MNERIQDGQVGVLLRFATVGVLTAALYAILLIVAVEFAGWSPALSVGFAYVLAVSFNYLAHYTWTYRTGQPHRVAAPRYLTTIVVLLFINVVATAILPDLLDINYGVVQGLLMFLAIVVTFMTLSKWVFSPQGGST